MRLAHTLLLSNLAGFLLAWEVVAQSADVTFAGLNEALGIPVWADDHLWDDADDGAGKRLRWPAESRTADSSSFRLYPAKDARVLGVRPFSLALQGASGRVAQLSMVFANKGDVIEMIDLPPGLTKVQADRERERQIRDFAKFIEADAAAIAAKLTRVLGEPRGETFGQGGKAKEKVLRWDWKDHSILLAAPRGEYVAVRVLPTAVADGEKAERVSDADLMTRLASRVVKRPNGDVIVGGIPMVDQGPKGYCVPATWERVLRYLGVPADMYVLAMAGSTGVGGGTSMEGMVAGVTDVVRAAGRRLTATGGRVTTRTVARSIDVGVPLMWTMFVVPELNHVISLRSGQRANVSDWQAYGTLLEPWRKAARGIRVDPANAHMCLITGYNHATREIAISDSWGPQFAERWITEEEATAISSGQFFVVSR